MSAAVKQVAASAADVSSQVEDELTLVKVSGQDLIGVLSEHLGDDVPVTVPVLKVIWDHDASHLFAVPCGVPK
jgi:hypothetical protein